MLRTTAALAPLLLPNVVMAAEPLVRMSATKDGAPPVSDATLAFAIAALLMVAALYAVHRLVNRRGPR